MAGSALPPLPEFPEVVSPGSAQDGGLMLPASPMSISPATTPGRAVSPASATTPGSNYKGSKLKRQHTNVEPLGAMAASCSSKFLAPPMPVPSAIAKRAREDGYGPLRLPSMESVTDTTPRLRRLLTPRISWNTLLNDASEDGCMPASSPIARSASRTFCPSPPPRPASSPTARASGARNCASSPPPRPEKLRSFAFRAPPTPLGNRQASSENWGGGNRFAEDFEDARVIGSGSFAVVYRARNRIDKQEYAIKKTKKTLGRSERRREILQEALALASVAIDSPCPYIVRYFASWVEDERLFIQTELCDGSLKDWMLKLRQTRPHDPRLDQGQLSFVIRDVCSGLAVLHAKNLVHLDVKPENILVKHLLPSPCRGVGDPSKIHKIADLGLATAAMGSGCDEINEGDSRYLAREVLQGNFSDLTKADVFSLGLTCYELATNPKELPCNGEEWHRLRDGCIADCFASQLSPPMIALIRCMVHPEQAERPPCVKVLEHDAISQLRPGELPAGMVQELQSQLRRQTEAAELEQRRRASAEEKADRYWTELLHMKRQALTAATEPMQSAPDLQPVASPKPPRGYKRSLTT